MRWLTAAALVLIANMAVADQGWLAPELVPDNPVLEIAKSRFLTRDARVLVLGPEDSSGRYFKGTPAFWSAVIENDLEGIVGESRPIDSVGMSYWPPMTVWFPTKIGLEEIHASAQPEILRDWDSPDRQVWIFNLRDFAEDQPNMVLVYFKLDFATGQEPGVCHARQIITILYTGEADEAGLAACLQTARTE